MLRDRGIEYAYREYRREPLSEDEVRTVLSELGLSARDVLRRRDAVARKMGLTGDEAEDELIRAMSEHPTLLERPIGRSGGRAVVGRPPERLLELVDAGR